MFNMTKICQIVHSEKLSLLAINILKAWRKKAFVSHFLVDAAIWQAKLPGTSTMFGLIPSRQGRKKDARQQRRA